MFIKVIYFPRVLKSKQKREIIYGYIYDLMQ